MIESQGRGMGARPLEGRRILITRPREKAARMGEMFDALGAQVRIAPTIQIREPDDWAPLDEAIRSIGRYDWIIFTSANGPKYFAGRLDSLGIGREEGMPARASLLAIGPATADAVARHFGKKAREGGEKICGRGRCRPARK